jgi:exodeoxyribonuclease V gamma subunit
MIGMNHNVFPRTDFEFPFDLIKKNPQRGDRSLRDEDRYIFLETILSARKGLYISYTGQNIQDNSEIPPSIVVSEFIDFLTDLFPGQMKPAGSFFFRHPLHSFSSRYFTGEGPFISYSEENFKALQSRDSKNKNISFIIRPLDHEEEPEEIEVRDLVNFFHHPVRSLLEKIIGLDYRRERTFIPENSEPFAFDGLERYSLENEILDSFLTGKDYRTILERVKKEGELPHGRPGDVQFERMVPGIARFSNKVREQMKGELLDPVEISFDLKGTIIHGVLDKVRNDTILHYNYKKSRGRDFIRPWIEHLAAACAGHEQLPQRSVLVHEKRTWKLDAVEKPEDILEDLVTLYRKGTREPLPFFPDTSYGYAESIDSGKTDEQALKAARKLMTGSGSNRGEKWNKGDLDDPYNSRCFTIERINLIEFKALSMRVFGPFLEAVEKV